MIQNTGKSHMVSKIVLALFVLTSFVVHASDPWLEYKEAVAKGRCRNVIEHVQHLSQFQAWENPDVLKARQDALRYFLSTGGKHGFAQRSSTAKERLILTQALVFLSIVHGAYQPAKPLVLLAVRRGFGIKTETSREQIHFIKTQRMISATRILLKVQMPDEEALRNCVESIYNQECFLSYLETQKRTSFTLPEWDKEVKEFTKIVTKALNRVVKETFDQLPYQFSFEGKILSVDLQEPVSNAQELAFQNKLRGWCVPCEDLFGPVSKASQQAARPKGLGLKHRPMKIILENGLVIQRNENGSMVLKPTRSVSLGIFHLGPGSVMSIGSRFVSEDLELNKDQTEAEFLSALSAVSRILEKVYL